MKRKRVLKKRFGLIVMICLLMIVTNQLVTVGYVPSSEENIMEYDQDYATDKESIYSLAINEAYPWNLILVNEANVKPQSYQLNLLKLSNGEEVDSRIYPELQEMFDAASSEGIYLLVRDGYRTHKEQKRIFNKKLRSYMREGYSKEEATKLTKKWVATPGTSEHELGLAVDINADQDKSNKEEVYQWLEDNAPYYGFILRYPEGKEAITGINYEPWHYRYVGKEVALEITENDLTLEEYYEEMKIGY